MIERFFGCGFIGFLSVARLNAPYYLGVFRAKKRGLSHSRIWGFLALRGHAPPFFDHFFRFFRTPQIFTQKGGCLTPFSDPQKTGIFGFFRVFSGCSGPQGVPPLPRPPKPPKMAPPGPPGPPPPPDPRGDPPKTPETDFQSFKSFKS